MSPETKEKALEKWKTFDPRVGYPDKWRDWTGLETGRESYLDNVLAAREFNYQWDIGTIGQPVDTTEWGMRPQTDNASYTTLANQSTYHSAEPQPPVFDPTPSNEHHYSRQQGREASWEKVG